MHKETLEFIIESILSSEVSIGEHSRKTLNMVVDAALEDLSKRGLTNSSHIFDAFSLLNTMLSKGFTDKADSELRTKISTGIYDLFKGQTFGGGIID